MCKHTSNRKNAMTTFPAMTRILPRNNTKSPTVLIAITRSTLLSSTLNAFTRATQKLVELIATI